MANPRTHKNKQSSGSKKNAPKQVRKDDPISLFDILNKWVESNAKALLIIIFICSALFSFLMFQLKMDIGGDDSFYLQKAYDLIHKGIFPTYKGPMYPIVLSLFVAIFGLNIVVLKLLSFCFTIVALYFMYRAFKGRIPSFLLYTMLFFTATNSFILVFASVTYNEAFFTMLQYAFFFIAFKLIDKSSKSSEEFTLEGNYRLWLTMGFLMFAMILTRNIAVSSLVGIMAFFISRKQYKYVLYAIGAFLVFQLPMMGFEKFILHLGAQWGNQGNMLLQKDPYNPAAGNETMAGFFKRFFENSNIYLSRRLFQILGLQSESSIANNGFLAFCIVVLSLFSLYRCFKSKNHYMILVCFYVASILSATFFCLQIQWDNPRMISIYVPLIFLVIFYGFYDALKNVWAGRLVVVGCLTIVLLASVIDTLGKAKNNAPILTKNIHGDLLYGFTPDWVNYIKMSQWCANNLPSNSLVATRKYDVSFIYSGKEIFFPVYTVYSTNADTVLNFLKRNNVNYVMLASLRANANAADGNIINTLWRMMQPVAEKYPQKLKMIHQEGTAEPAYLYQIMQ
jgi:hypothetical protein